MLYFVLNNTDNTLLKKLEVANKEEMLSWKLPNLFYPLFAIAASMICFLLFKKSENVTMVAFINLILNGSIPLVALNRLSSLGINLFRFDKGKEKAKSLDTYNLRNKIHYYSQALVFTIAIFYIFQVIHTPFDLSWWILAQIILSVFCIYQSLKVSKYAFLLQEKLIDTTFDKEIRDEIEENGLTKNWDN